MGLIQKPKFKKLNKITGKWETITPQPEEYNPNAKQLNVLVIGKTKCKYVHR